MTHFKNYILLKTKSKVRTGEQLNPSLTPNTVYKAIGIEYDSYRVIDNNNEPYLFDDYIFDVVDDSVKKTWFFEEDEDGDWCFSPEELSAQYFYEDFFDEKEYALKTYFDFCKKYELELPTYLQSYE